MTTPAELAISAQALARDVSAACTDPGDAIRTLGAWAASMAPLASDGAVPSMTGATRDVLRRAALIEGARAVARYQPSSYDDAAALREAVCTWLDAEIAIAGMQGADATFESLRVLRAAVVNDLTQRGAQLSRMAPVTLNATLPASVVAQRLYQDVTRADGLIAQVDPVHPAFMPPRFMALSE